MTTAVALRLTDPSPPPDALSSLTEIRAARKAQRDLKRREICAIASFADTMSYSDRADERDLIPYGCDGTPLVQEFASLELAAALGIGDEAASITLGCVLNVRHRLPLAWQASGRIGSAGSSANGSTTPRMTHCGSGAQRRSAAGA